MNPRALLLLVLSLMLVAGAALAAPESTAEATVNLELRDVDARAALEVLFKAADKQFVLGTGVSGTISSISFKDVPFETALRQLTRSAGLVYRFTDGIYNVAVKPQLQAAPPAPPVPTPPDPVPVAEDNTIIEKINLIHTSAAEILASFQQGGANNGVSAWVGVPIGTYQVGQSGQGGQIPQVGPYQPSRQLGVNGSPSPGSPYGPVPRGQR